MQWTDKAIILSARKLGENSAIISFMTPEHGVVSAVDKGAFGKRKRGIYQSGNIVVATWHARLPEHMGTLSAELVASIAAYALDDRRKLAALVSATEMIKAVLPERDKQPETYQYLEQFIVALHHDEDWCLAYARLEFALLEHAGFGLDLTCCASTGGTEELIYVSPRSGRAVSREAGEPYHDKLLLLPEFLLEKEMNSPVNMSQTLDAIRLCGYFLSQRIFAPRGHSLPVARMRFVEMLPQKDRVVGEVTS